MLEYDAYHSSFIVLVCLSLSPSGVSNTSCIIWATQYLVLANELSYSTACIEKHQKLLQRTQYPNQATNNITYELNKIFHDGLQRQGSFFSIRCKNKPNFFIIFTDRAHNGLVTGGGGGGGVY